jgi:hypothetical protein
MWMRRMLIVTVLFGLAGSAFCQEAADSPPAVKKERRELTGPKPEPIDPPAPSQVEQSIGRGVDFLVTDQNKDGSWGSPRNTKGLNIYAPVPGAHHAFRGAVTALCVSALIQTGDDRPEVLEALEKGETWLLENLPKLRRATPDAIYNVWGHGYALQAFARMYHRHADDPKLQAQIVEQIKEQYELLERYASVDGGWGYYDFNVGAKRPASSSTSFVNAAVLVAMDEAKTTGAKPPEKMVERAIVSLKRQQLPDYSYLYGEYLKWRPVMGVNRAGGSLGRSQACNLALRLWGDEEITDQVLSVWLNRLFARNGWLDIGRKRPIPHESWFQVAGYFYYFGHYYAARCIDELPADQQPFFRDHMAALLLERQEQDGSWWDYPLYNYHRPYGTAFALMTLVPWEKPDAGKNP